MLRKAKKIIPGGNQLLSKRSEIFLPGLWPTYYQKAKGYKIWDLDNKMYYDFAGMGVTACSLGYSNNIINSKIINCLKSGSLTTLNYQPNNEVSISGGIDMRYYKGEHYREVYDLLGGDYTIDDANGMLLASARARVHHRVLPRVRHRDLRQLAARTKHC